MAWLVSDYGDVISFTPTPADVATLAGLCRLSVENFEAAYWARRLDYDRGDIDAYEFWSGVVSGQLSPERLVACIETDIASWTRFNVDSTAAIEDAARRGYRLALLSNAPTEIARALDADPWFARFEHRLFSCDLHLTKPDPAIYLVLLERLGARADEVVFVDDRAENVASARALGIASVEFHSPADLIGI